jgi:hypothetical protein
MRATLHQRAPISYFGQWLFGLRADPGAVSGFIARNGAA